MPASRQSEIVKSALRRGGFGDMFTFEILQPGQMTGGADKVTFPGFVSNISDSFSPDWGQYNDMGRGDPKVMLRSFNRSISVDFKVVALSNRDTSGYDNTFNIFAEKLNILGKSVHPHYVPGKGFVGRYLKFTIAKLYVNEFGYVTNLNITMNNDVPWHTNLQGEGERPIVADISMTINWIGDKRPDAARSLSYSDRQRTKYRLLSDGTIQPL